MLNDVKLSHVLTLICLILSWEGVVLSQDIPTYEPESYSIVFTSYPRPATGDIYVMSDTGADVRVLVENAHARFPVFSPVDLKLAIIADLSRTSDLLIFDFNDNSITRITANIASEAYPRWTSDGQQIAYSTRIEEDWEIFVADIDGSNQVNITNQPATHEGLAGFDWSLDGQQIVFTQVDEDSDNPNAGLYVMDADGTNRRYLFEDISEFPPLGETLPVWSPTGEYIAFSTFRLRAGVHLVEPDGENFQVSAAMNGIPTSLSWSPDGSRVAYTLCDEGTAASCEIYTVDIETGEQTQLTNNELLEEFPTWVLTERLQGIEMPIHLDLSAVEDNS